MINHTTEKIQSILNEANRRPERSLRRNLGILVAHIFGADVNCPLYGPYKNTEVMQKIENAEFLRIGKSNDIIFEHEGRRYKVRTEQCYTDGLPGGESYYIDLVSDAKSELEERISAMKINYERTDMLPKYKPKWPKYKQEISEDKSNDKSFKKYFQTDMKDKSELK